MENHREIGYQWRFEWNIDGWFMECQRDIHGILILPYLAALTFSNLAKIMDWGTTQPPETSPAPSILVAHLLGPRPGALSICGIPWEFLWRILSTKSSFSKGGKIHFRIHLKAFKYLCSTTVFAQLQLEVSNLPRGAGAQKGVAKHFRSPGFDKICLRTPAIQADLCFFSRPPWRPWDFRTWKSKDVAHGFPAIFRKRKPMGFLQIPATLPAGKAPKGWRQRGAKVTKHLARSNSFPSEISRRNWWFTPSDRF